MQNLKRQIISIMLSLFIVITMPILLADTCGEFTSEALTTEVTTVAQTTEPTTIEPTSVAPTTEPTTEVPTTEPTTTYPSTEPTTEAPITEAITERTEKWEVLTASKGTVNGPSGRETYYNLDMSGVIKIMRSEGYNYQYWEREDGAKMFGSYIMCAANLKIRPRGSIVETSLGKGIVCDTGGFASANPTQLDIATNW